MAIRKLPVSMSSIALSNAITLFGGQVSYPICSSRLIGRRRFTFVLVREASYLHIAELEPPHQTFENHQSFRALHGIVIEMSLSGENYIDPNGGKLAGEPLWVKAC
jgi:hypothetical protein